MKEFLEWWEAGDLDVVVVSVLIAGVTGNGYFMCARHCATSCWVFLSTF